MIYSDAFLFYHKIEYKYIFDLLIYLFNQQITIFDLIEYTFDFIIYYFDFMKNRID